MDEDEDYLLQEEQDRVMEEQLGSGQGDAQMGEAGAEQEQEQEQEDDGDGDGHAGVGQAGPSGGNVGNDDDEDAANSDWLASSDDEEHEYFAHGQTAQDRQAQSSDGGGGGAANDDDGASSTYTQRLHQGLQDIPGWNAMIMGQGIKAEPPLFATGMTGYWAQFTNTGPFPDGVKCRPARVIDLGFVGAWQQASDAERVSDMTAQTDEGARARTVATCALMGLLSVGMAKGLVASPNHSELSEARRKDPEELSKAERKLNGKVKTYTYCPNATSTDPVEREETAMMFSFVHVAMHNPQGKYVGFKILMLIFDKGFSLDDLVNKVMKENALIKRSGNMNEMLEEQRTQKMQQQNKQQRSQINDENLEVTAATQYKRICGNQDYLKFLINVGGQTYGQHGRPYYECIGRDTPPGCTIHEFAKCPEGEYGGIHPIGPSISHNMKRHVAPSAESPGVNVFTAGTLDARGKPIELHECLTDPRLWFDPNTGDFDPPPHVKDNGWCHICHDPAVTNIMSAPLPHKMHGNVEPEECLLRIFWERNKESNPILKKAVDSGLTSFERNRDSVLALFHRMEDTMDPEQANLARAVLETEMLSPDSLDKSAAEEATLERRAYGKASTDVGEKWVLSVRQPLRDISIEQEKVHAMVNDDDKQTRLEIRTRNYDLGQAGLEVQYDAPSEMRKRRAKHAEATKATIKLGLQRFQHTYNRAKCVKSIPPGYYDVAKKGLDATIKEAGEIAKRRAARSTNLGRIVNPDDPNALVGTANIGQAHGQSLVATDLTPFGHHRAFLMRLFSSGVNIAGRDVKLMLECHVHAFEPFQEVSFFLMLCGGPGSGKSMRAKRMMALLPDGWVKGSGGGSAKAGMNGGFDHLCGRLVYYDEITSDFASQDSERIEYLKSITMEQRVLNTRTVKTIGSNGIESFTTVVLDSLHYESHLMCTNCGPLGLKGDTEPSTNRAALSDRSWAHIVHSNDDHEVGDVEFDVQKCSDEVKQQVNRYRVCACLVAYVLIFIKHIPSCRPNLSYAMMLCNKWYEILWTEYNLPRPSKRKKIKLRMMLEVFATESAVFEKFCMPESGIDFPDMRPDENGQLSPFCIEQLVDVVCSLQRCVDHEVIHNAWSHSLDHSPATSAHVFQMKTVLAQLHGSELDRSVLVGDPVTEAAPQAQPEPSNQGRVDPVAADEASRDHMDQQFALPSASAPAAADAAPPADATPAPAPVDAAPAPAPAPATAPGDAPPVTPRTGTPPNWPNRNSTRTEPPNDNRGNPTHSHYPLAVKTMDENMTRQRAADTADEFATTRELRCELSNRALTKKIEREGSSEHKQLTKLLTDCVGERDKEPKHRMTSTGALISAKQAAGACMPNASDLLGRGMDMSFLVEIANGKAAKQPHFGIDEARIGIKKKGWEFETLPGEVVLKGPADFDFNWARLTAFVKNSTAAESAAPAAGAKQKSSLWSNSARVISSVSKAVFSLMALHSMSLESMRDVLFMIAWSPIENKIRIPKKVQYNRWGQSSGGKSGFDMQEDTCMETCGHGFTDAKAIGNEGIHPKHMFSKKNAYQLDPAFEAPANMERPHNSTVGLSLGQKRLDHLTDHRALPVCIMPEGFERGVPIKADEATNGIYFNKHTASEQAAFVLETGLFLATVPGIAGGRFTTVPDSFKGTRVYSSQEKDRQEAAREVGAIQQQQQQPPPPPPQTGPSYDAAAALAAANQAADDQELGPNQVRPRDNDSDEEPDNDESYDEPLRTPPLPESEANSSDLESVRNSVLRPESDDLNVRPQPGASDRAARASVDPSAAVPALPYEWDQLAIFFSIKMVETLHNDVHAYVGKYCSKFPDVYGDEEKLEETLAGLPQISIRFPGMVDSKTVQSGEEKTKELMPLSCSVPLKQSRYCDVAKHIQSTRASKGLTEAVHSFAHGRAIAFNDPEVLEHEAEARGLDSGVVLEGNLFARSTWVRFTLSALDARGMCTPEEEARVHDQGLCMRLRVRNHRSASKHDDSDPGLDTQAAARPHTFAAQERNKRKLGDAGEDDDVPMESLPAKRRSLERECEKRLLDESMDIEPSV